MATPLRYQEFATLWTERLRAPKDERLEMNAAIQNHVYDASTVRKLSENMPQSVVEGEDWLEKIEKAALVHNRIQRSEKGQDRKSVFTDPLFQWSEIRGLLPKRGRFHPSLNRAMAAQDPLIQSILQNKKNRMIRHAKEARDGIQAALEGAEGFDVVPLFKGQWVNLTPSEEAERQKIVNFILNSGDLSRFEGEGKINRETLNRETFSQMLSIWVEQRYVLDAVAVEITRTRNGRDLSGLYATDGGAILRTDDSVWPYLETRESMDHPDARYAQVFNNQILTTFSSDDLYYDYANPRDALGSRGYGYSETEMSVKLTTAILNVLNTNNAQFDRNALPQGFMAIYGQMASSKGFVDWQSEWDAYRLGAGGDYGLPAVNIPDSSSRIEYIKTGFEPGEMVFSSYTNFVGAIRCAIFGTDVNEVNISPFGGNNSGLNSGKDHQSRVDETRNRSFLPDMHRIETMYNEMLAPLLKGRWRFAFTGLVKQDPERAWDKMMTVATIDEVRGVIGLPPLGGVVGSALAQNPSISQMSVLAEKEGANLDSEAQKPRPGKEEHAPSES